MEPLPFPGPGPAADRTQDRADPASVAGPACRPLTPRQERFCQAYVVCPNAAEAARRAGYARESARNQGWRLLNARRIRARLLDIQAELGRAFDAGLDPFIGKLEVVYRQAIEDRHALAAVRAVELQARLARLKHRLPPAAEDAAQAFRAEAERRRARGRALAEWRRAALSKTRAGDDPDLFNPDAYGVPGKRRRTRTNEDI